MKLHVCKGINYIQNYDKKRDYRANKAYGTNVI